MPVWSASMKLSTLAPTTLAASFPAQTIIGIAAARPNAYTASFLDGMKLPRGFSVPQNLSPYRPVRPAVQPGERALGWRRFVDVPQVGTGANYDQCSGGSSIASPLRNRGRLAARERG